MKPIAREMLMPTAFSGLFLFGLQAAAQPRLTPHGFSSCAAIHQNNRHAADGVYSILVQEKRIQVYCHDMRGNPREYLEVDAETNCSYYAKGPNSDGAKTCYQRVLFDPQNFTINVTDATFLGEHWGTYRFGNDIHTVVPYAAAGDCIGDNSAAGWASINLKGTPFAVASEQLKVQGYHATGTTEYGPNKRTVRLTGGGNCGWNMALNGKIKLEWVGR